MQIEHVTHSKGVSTYITVSARELLDTVQAEHLEEFALTQKQVWAFDKRVPRLEERVGMEPVSIGDFHENARVVGHFENSVHGTKLSWYKPGLETVTIQDEVTLLIH